MSDSAQLLAFRTEPSDATRVAALVLAWLVDRRIVEAMPTDSGLGRLAHRPGPRASDAVLPPNRTVGDFRTLRTNGMEVEHSDRPELRTDGDEMPVFRCPSCESEMAEDDVVALFDDLSSPYRPAPTIACAACGTSSAVSDLRVEGGAFANVVLRFWNWWPLSETFVAEVAAHSGLPVTVLYERV